jgi:hypothetical protein
MCGGVLMNAFLKHDSVGSNIVDRVYGIIKRLVISFDIKPGHQIHIESLADHLNTSVTPVREALNRLLNEDLIRRHKGRGFQNRDIDKHEIAELFMLRGALTIGAFYSLMNSHSDEEISNLIEDFTMPDWSEGVSHIPLCTKLIDAGGNRELIRIYSTLSCKIHFISMIYAESTMGARNIVDYTEALKHLLCSRNLVDCINVVDTQVKIQVASLDYIIPEAYGVLFTDKSPSIQRCGAAKFATEKCASGDRFAQTYRT